VKIETQLPEPFRTDFSKQAQELSFRMPRKISAQTDKQFSSYGSFKQPKKGYFLPFFGCKIETQLPEAFRRNVFHQVQ
jgi:hypothetical protein